MHHAGSAVAGRADGAGTVRDQGSGPWTGTDPAACRGLRVCRTDLHVVDGDLSHPELPLVPGHEIVGEVLAAGAGVERFRPGQRVGIRSLSAMQTRLPPRHRRRMPRPGPFPFRQAVERYLTAHEAGWKNAKHRQQWQNTLTTYAFPHIGDLPVGTIETVHVTAVLEPIWQARSETASRLRGRLEAVLDFAHVRGWRSATANCGPSRSTRGR